MSTILTARPITDYAIIVDPRDNVAVVKQATAPGLVVTLTNGRALRVKDDVPPGHVDALRRGPKLQWTATKVLRAAP